jgi:hypothetical protein
MSSPTQRTKKFLQDLGWTIGSTERWNPHARIRQDLYGFIDLLAINDEETLGVQATASAVANRVQKSKAQPHFQRWINGPNRRFIVIGWTLKGKMGKRKKYTPRIVEVLRNGEERVWRDDQGVQQEQASETGEVRS